MPTEREQIGACTLVRGDCREVLPILTGMDAIVTDPPYGLGENERRVASREHLAQPRDYGAFCWDKVPCSPEDIALLCQCARWQIIFGGNYFSLPASSCWLVWDKQQSGDFADCELAWTNLPKAVRKITWLWNGMIRKGSEARYHPTQKPVGVMKWCIGQLPLGCHVVADPFMGVGTTGVACVELGLAFVGIEIEPRYFDIACQRITDAYAQPDLFVPTPARPEQQALFAGGR